jgi:BlaI family penicillinase repressor
MAQFTQGELEIMQILWEHGPLKPGDLQKLFPRPMKNAAIRAALRVLVEKGHVSRAKNGKAYFYQAITPQQSAMQKMIQKLKDAFCGGSPAMLIAHLMENEKLSEDDIEELQHIAEKRLTKKSPK